MKRALVVLTILITLLATKSRVIAITQNAQLNTRQIHDYVVQESKLYGVNPLLSECLVSHESQWMSTKLGPEKIGVSQGLWQIYSKAWPTITRAQAFDPIWATNWALSQIRAGHVNYWTTYRKYCSDIPVFL